MSDDGGWKAPFAKWNQDFSDAREGLRQASRSTADLLDELKAAVVTGDYLIDYTPDSKLPHDAAAARVPRPQVSSENALLKVETTLNPEQASHYIQNLDDKIKEFTTQTPITKADVPHFNSDVIHPWQAVGVAQMLHMEKSPVEGCILADEMGLGKTIQCIPMMLLDKVSCIDFSPSIVVTKQSLVKQWKREVQKFVKGRDFNILVLDEEMSIGHLQLVDYHLIITHYDRVESEFRKWRQQQLEFEAGRANGYTSGWRGNEGRPATVLFSDYVHRRPFVPLIIDEIQHIKNTKSLMYAAIKSIPHRAAILVSGTFIHNKWYDCYAAISFLKDHPFRTETDFRNTFGILRVGTEFYDDPGKKELKRLQKYLQSVTIARPASLLALPPHKHTTEFFKLTAQEAEEVAAYVLLYQTYYSWDVNDKTKMSYMVRAQQASSNLALIKFSKKVNGVTGLAANEFIHLDELDPDKPMDIAKWRRWQKYLTELDEDSLMSSRARAFLDLYRRLRAEHPNEKILVFSRFTSFLDILSHILRIKEDVECLRFDGRFASNVDREQALQIFRDLPPANGVPLLISSLSGGAGLNLQEASIVIQTEVWWVRNDEYQAYSRVLRHGQMNEVKIHTLYADNSTADSVIQEIRDRKEEIYDILMEPVKRAHDQPLQVISLRSFDTFSQNR